jgi:hypothetical protein
MKSPGSVLIVVLGLLAILAIVGVTFVTMSSMDRSTASNFALQSQFMLAADGAIDYVCDHLVKDLWQFNPWAFKSNDPLVLSEDPYMPNTLLLTDLRDFVDPHTGAITPKSFRTLRGAVATAKYCAFIRNEPWDAPGAFPPTGAPSNIGLPEDPWLATTLDMRTLVDLAKAEKGGTQDLTDPMGPEVTFAYSYGYYLGPLYPPNFPNAPAGTPTQPFPYGLPCWWKDARATMDYTNRANNLGIPFGDAETKTFQEHFGDSKWARHVDPYWPPSGVWIPEISFPFENGIIRVSVTVQDNNALLNANIHENGGLSGAFAKDLISGAAGRGYFVSDVAIRQDPNGIEPMYLLNGTTDKKVSGRWPKDEQTGEVKSPTNPSLMQTEVENPTGGSLAAKDRPFTLEEEFELRRYLGTSYRSRLEAMGGTNFEIDPALDALVPNESRLTKRMALTTVGWTSEVRPDPWAAKDPPGSTSATPVGFNHQLPPASGTYSAHKADVNLGIGTLTDAEDAQHIFRSLWYAHCFDETNTVRAAQIRQFVANIDGFRNGRDEPGIQLRNMTVSANTAAVPTEACYAASRQPIIDKISFTSSPDPNDPNGKIYTVKVELLSPWEGNCVGDAVVNPTSGLTYPGGCNLEVSGGATPTITPLGGRMKNKLMNGIYVGINSYEIKASVPQDGNLSAKLAGLRITVGGAPPTGIVLDEVLLETDGLQLLDSMQNEAKGTIGRPIYIAYDPTDKWGDYRGSNNDKKIGPTPGGKENPVRVVYIDVWKTLPEGSPGAPIDTWVQPAPPADGAIPIRFPRSCQKIRGLPSTTDYKGLPPIATQTCPGVNSAEGTFKAIPRLGDLSQILWWDGTGTFWPWTTRVSKKGLNPSNKTLKFPGVVPPDPNYMNPTLYFTMTSTSGYTRPADFNLLYFANVLCTGGPWLDGLDNDNDGAKDESLLTGAGGMPVDTGEKNNGQLFGPELRVAGKINLNTATRDTLKAVETGVGVTGLWDAVKAARQTGRILTPAFLLDPDLTRPWFGKFTITSDPTGALTGDEDKRREAFARISNIVTIRSDTFSIYGTVQYVDAAGFKRKNATILAPFVKRTRRFWALVDRSPTAAFTPADTTHFIRPRVMNFQWMD